MNPAKKSKNWNNRASRTSKMEKNVILSTTDTKMMVMILSSRAIWNVWWIELDTRNTVSSTIFR